MRCLLLAVSVALACAAQGIYVPQERVNLDVQKVAGAWYPMAMVASDTALLNTKSAPLRLYIKELRPTAQDGLEIIGHRREDGSCVERKMFAQKTGAPASFQISIQQDGNVAPAPVQQDGNVAPAPDQQDGKVAPAPDQKDGKVAPAPDQQDGNVAPSPDQQDGNVAPAPDQQDGNVAPAPDQQDGKVAPAADQQDGNMAPAPYQKDCKVAPSPDQQDGKVAPAPDQQDGNVAHAPDQQDGNVAPAPDQEEGKIHVLDTDYKNYLFLCMEAAAPAPAKRSLACQYLARTPKSDEAAMEQFNRAVKRFSMGTSITFTPTQAEERCRV